MRFNEDVYNNVQDWSLERQEFALRRLREEASSRGFEFNGESSVRNVLSIINSTIGADSNVSFGTYPNSHGIRMGFLRFIKLGDSNFEIISSASIDEDSTLRYDLKQRLWILKIKIDTNSADMERACNNVIYIREKSLSLHGDGEIAEHFKALSAVKVAINKSEVERVFEPDMSIFPVKKCTETDEELEAMAKQNYEFENTFYDETIIEEETKSEVVIEQDIVLEEEAKSEEIVVEDQIIVEEQKVEIVSLEDAFGNFKPETPIIKKVKKDERKGLKKPNPTFTKPENFNAEKFALVDVTDELIEQLSEIEREILYGRSCKQFAFTDTSDVMALRQRYKVFLDEELDEEEEELYF